MDTKINLPFSLKSTIF